MKTFSSLNTFADEDPILHDPVFQRQIVTTQIVSSTIPRQKNSETVVKTVGGRSLVIKTNGQDVTTVNDVPVIDIIQSGNSEVYFEININ